MGRLSRTAPGGDGDLVSDDVVDADPAVATGGAEDSGHPLQTLVPSAVAGQRDSDLPEDPGLILHGGISL